MIDLMLKMAADPALEKKFRNELSDYVAAAQSSAGAGDRNVVGAAEAEVQADPEGSFHFDSAGFGTLRAGETEWPAGRFETPSIDTLLKRLGEGVKHGPKDRVRLWVLDGESPATDIGALQATAGEGTLFQVASQFNCLESSKPAVTPVKKYFKDPTQGPRASISTFPGTLLRHYAAPGDDGSRFVQTSDGPQLNLLDAVCTQGVARVNNGYLTSGDITDRSALVDALENNFKAIRVGVHEDVPVALGYNWDGAVTGSPRIGQVFTSTFAGGKYSRTDTDDFDYHRICGALLRSAYLGTLLAAEASERRKVVLTMIGGGVFGNPVRLIWDSICQAIDEIEPRVADTMDVVVNGRDLSRHIAIDDLLPAVRARNGAIVSFGGKEVAVQR